MRSKTRRFIGMAAAVLAISGAIPATTAGAALIPCQATSQSTGSEVAIVLRGNYVDRDGGDVTLTCSIYQGTTRVASVRDPLAGPVAALVSDQRLGTAPFRVCYTVSIEPLDAWAPYYHYSNC